MSRELTDEEFVEALRLCRLADAAAEGGQTPAGHYLGKLRDLLAAGAVPEVDPLEGQWADVELVRAVVMAEVEHCVWASTGGRATMNAEESARLAGAEGVKDYLTRGGLDTALFGVLTDPRVGSWRQR